MRITEFCDIILLVKKIAIIACLCLLLTGLGTPQIEMPSITSTPSRMHFSINAYCSVGQLDIPAWGNRDYPLFDAVPRVKAAMIALVPGTTMYGSGLAKLLNPKSFMDFMRYYSSNLHLVSVSEQYNFFGDGQAKTAGYTYNAITNAGITPEQAKQNIEKNLVASKADWTMPGTFRNFDSVKVFTSSNPLNLRDILWDQKSTANGQALEKLAQTMMPTYGWLDSKADIEMTQPYLTIPVAHAQDQYLDFMMRPVGTNFDDNGTSSTSSEAVTYVRSKVASIDPSNIRVSEGFDGVKDITADLKVRYKNEFRFQCEVDPPNLAGVTMLPTSPTNLGVTTMYATEGTIHKVQSTKTIDTLYKWLPQTDVGTGQDLFMVPAVRERVLDDRTYWQLTTFRLFYPDASYDENGVRTVEEKSVDVDPVRFEEISGEHVAYINVTNMPWLEEAKNTAFIEKIDRPFRLVAVYEPSDIAPRGTGVVAGSTRMRLMWNVTSQMKELARKKAQEQGENWWKGSFPTYYTVNIKGDVTKKIEKINPLDESVIVDGLKPGGKYFWELETWVSDEWGSSGLKNTWQSEVVKTKPLPSLIGVCVQTSAIKIDTEVEQNGDEDWVITVPTVYELGNVKLKPLRFSALDRTKNKTVALTGAAGVAITDEMVNNKKVIKCRINVAKVPDIYQKNTFDQIVVYVEFQPLQIKVFGDCVDTYGTVIGQVSGTAGTWWPAADGPGVENPLRTVEAPLLIKGNKLWRFVKWNWVGAIVATKMPYVDGARGVSVLVVKASGCQPDPDKPLIPKFYAQYEEIPVECFALGVGFAVDWKPVANKGVISVSPDPDCPGDNKKYMAGTKVSVGPAPEVITVDGNNYKFVGWIIGDQAYPGQVTVSVTMDKAYSVYANYQASSGKFQLSWYADVDGRRTKLDFRVSPLPDRDGFYESGTMVQLGPVPLTLDNGKYVLAGWAVDGEMKENSSLNSTLDLMMDANHRVALIYSLSK